MNKKGLLIELIALMVVGFIVVVFFVGYQYAHNLITEKLVSPHAYDSVVNVSDAAINTFGKVNSGLNFLNIISFSIILGFLVGTIIMAYYSRQHPIMAVVYIFIVIILVIASVYISNAYQKLETNSVLGSTMANYTASNYFFENLPLMIAIVGIFGLIFCIVGAFKGQEGQI